MKRLLILIPCFIAMHISAQVTYNNLNELLKSAEKNSLVFQTAALQQQAAKNNTALTRSGLMPKTNAFGTSDYYPVVPSLVVPAPLLGGPQGKFTKLQFGMPAVFATGVELSVPVINFSLWEALKTAKQQEQEVYHKIAARKEELCVQLIQLYYQHLFIKAISGINKSNGLSLQEVLRIIEARSRGGVVNPADLNRYKKLLLENEATAIDYQQQLEENDAAMHNLLNITSEVAIHISDSLSISTLQQLSEIINPEERPAYKAAQMARLVAEHQLTEAAKASYPKLNLTSRYTYQWQHSKESTVRFDAAAVGLKVEVPLFTGGVYKKQRLQAGLSLEAAQLTEQQTKASLQQQQQQWQAKYNASNRKAVLLKAELQLATENLRIALLHVKEGLMEYDEFNNIYIEYNQVQAAYFQNLADAIVYQLLLTNKF